MFYHIAKHPFMHYNSGDIVAKFNENVVNEFTSNGHVKVIEADDCKFPTLFTVNGVPAHWSNGIESLPECPQVLDMSYSFVEEVLAVEPVMAIPEYWSKDGMEDVSVDPLDESWIHHPEVLGVLGVEAVPAHWNNGRFTSPTQPTMNDPAYSFVEEVPSHISVQEDTELLAQHNLVLQKQAQIDLGKKVQACCDEMIACVIGYNMKNLTKEQITQLETDYAQISALLKGYRPMSAKPLIEAITSLPELKADLLEILSQFGF